MFPKQQTSHCMGWVVIAKQLACLPAEVKTNQQVFAKRDIALCIFCKLVLLHTTFHFFVQNPVDGFSEMEEFCIKCAQKATVTRPCGHKFCTGNEKLL